MPDDVDRLRAEIERRVSREVYDAHREAWAYQLVEIRRDHEELKASVAEGLRARQGLRQWMIAGIVIPLLVTAVNVALVLWK